MESRFSSVYCPCFNIEAVYTDLQIPFSPSGIPDGFLPVSTIELKAKFTSLATIESIPVTAGSVCHIHKCRNCGVSVAAHLPAAGGADPVTALAQGLVTREQYEAVVGGTEPIPPASWPLAPDARLAYVPALGLVAPVSAAGAELAVEPSPLAVEAGADTDAVNQTLLHELLSSAEDRHADLHRQIAAKLALYERQLRDAAAATVVREAAYYSAFATRVGLDARVAAEVSATAAGAWAPAPSAPLPGPSVPYRTPIALVPPQMRTTVESAELAAALESTLESPPTPRAPAAPLPPIEEDGAMEHNEPRSYRPESVDDDGTSLYAPRSLNVIQTHLRRFESRQPASVADWLATGENGIGSGSVAGPMSFVDSDALAAAGSLTTLADLG